MLDGAILKTGADPKTGQKCMCNTGAHVCLACEENRRLSNSCLQYVRSNQGKNNISGKRDQ